MPNRVKRAIKTRTKRKSNEEEASAVLRKPEERISDEEMKKTCVHFCDGFADFFWDPVVFIRSLQPVDAKKMGLE